MAVASGGPPDFGGAFWNGVRDAILFGKTSGALGADLAALVGDKLDDALLLGVGGALWPEGDEDRLWDLAETWRDFAAEINVLQRDYGAGVTKIVSAWGGDVGPAVLERWQELSSEVGGLMDVHAIAVQASMGARKAGTDIEFAKHSLIGMIIITMGMVFALAIKSFLNPFSRPAVVAGQAGLIMLARKKATERIATLTARMGGKQIGRTLPRAAAPAAARTTAPAFTRTTAAKAATAANSAARPTLAQTWKTVVTRDNIKRSVLSQVALMSGVNLAVQGEQLGRGTRDAFDLRSFGASTLTGVTAGLLMVPVRVPLHVGTRKVLPVKPSPGPSSAVPTSTRWPRTAAMLEEGLLMAATLPPASMLANGVVYQQWHLPTPREWAIAGYQGAFTRGLGLAAEAGGRKLGGLGLVPLNDAKNPVGYAKTSPEPVMKSAPLPELPYQHLHPAEKPLKFGLDPVTTGHLNRPDVVPSVTKASPAPHPSPRPVEASAPTHSKTPTTVVPDLARPGNEPAGGARTNEPAGGARTNEPAGGARTAAEPANPTRGREPATPPQSGPPPRGRAGGVTSVSHAENNTGVRPTGEPAARSAPANGPTPPARSHETAPPEGRGGGERTGPSREHPTETGPSREHPTETGPSREHPTETGTDRAEAVNGSGTRNGSPDGRHTGTQINATEWVGMSAHGGTQSPAETQAAIGRGLGRVREILEESVGKVRSVTVDQSGGTYRLVVVTRRGVSHTFEIVVGPTGPDQAAMTNIGGGSRRAKTHRVTISEDITGTSLDAAVGRAISHEVRETLHQDSSAFGRALRRTGPPSVLFAGSTVGPGPVRLSGHDAGRVQELQVMIREYAGAPVRDRPTLEKQLGRMVDELGLTNSALRDAVNQLLNPHETGLVEHLADPRARWRGTQPPRDPAWQQAADAILPLLTSQRGSDFWLVTREGGLIVAYTAQGGSVRVAIRNATSHLEMVEQLGRDLSAALERRQQLSSGIPDSLAPDLPGGKSLKLGPADRKHIGALTALGRLYEQLRREELDPALRQANDSTLDGLSAKDLASHPTAPDAVKAAAGKLAPVENRLRELIHGPEGRDHGLGLGKDIPGARQRLELLKDAMPDSLFAVVDRLAAPEMSTDGALALARHLATTDAVEGVGIKPTNELPLDADSARSTPMEPQDIRAAQDGLNNRFKDVYVAYSNSAGKAKGSVTFYFVRDPSATDAITIERVANSQFRITISDKLTEQSWAAGRDALAKELRNLVNEEAYPLPSRRWLWAKSGIPSGAQAITMTAVIQAASVGGPISAKLFLIAGLTSAAGEMVGGWRGARQSATAGDQRARWQQSQTGPPDRATLARDVNADIQATKPMLEKYGRPPTSEPTENAIVSTNSADSAALLARVKQILQTGVSSSEVPGAARIKIARLDPNDPNAPIRITIRLASPHGAASLTITIKGVAARGELVLQGTKFNKLTGRVSYDAYLGADVVAKFREHQQSPTSSGADPVRKEMLSVLAEAVQDRANLFSKEQSLRWQLARSGPTAAAGVGSWAVLAGTGVPGLGLAVGAGFLARAVTRAPVDFAYDHTAAAESSFSGAARSSDMGHSGKANRMGLGAKVLHGISHVADIVEGMRYNAHLLDSGTPPSASLLGVLAAESALVNPSRTSPDPGFTAERLANGRIVLKPTTGRSIEIEIHEGPHNWVRLVHAGKGFIVEVPRDGRGEIFIKEVQEAAANAVKVAQAISPRGLFQFLKPSGPNVAVIGGTTAINSAVLGGSGLSAFGNRSAGAAGTGPAGRMNEQGWLHGQLEAAGLGYDKSKHSSPADLRAGLTHAEQQQSATINDLVKLLGSARPAEVQALKDALRDYFLDAQKQEAVADEIIARLTKPKEHGELPHVTEAVDLGGGRYLLKVVPEGSTAGRVLRNESSFGLVIEVAFKPLEGDRAVAVYPVNDSAELLIVVDPNKAPAPGGAQPGAGARPTPREAFVEVLNAYIQLKLTSPNGEVPWTKILGNTTVVAGAGVAGVLASAVLGVNGVPRSAFTRALYGSGQVVTDAYTGQWFGRGLAVDRARAENVLADMTGGPSAVRLNYVLAQNARLRQVADVIDAAYDALYQARGWDTAKVASAIDGLMQSGLRDRDLVNAVHEAFAALPRDTAREVAENYAATVAGYRGVPADVLYQAHKSLLEERLADLRRNSSRTPEEDAQLAALTQLKQGWPDPADPTAPHTSRQILWHSPDLSYAAEVFGDLANAQHVAVVIANHPNGFADTLPPAAGLSDSSGVATVVLNGPLMSGPAGRDALHSVLQSIDTVRHSGADVTVIAHSRHAPIVLGIAPPPTNRPVLPNPQPMSTVSIRRLLLLDADLRDPALRQRLDQLASAGVLITVGYPDGSQPNAPRQATQVPIGPVNSGLNGYFDADSVARRTLDDVISGTFDPPFRAFGGLLELRPEEGWELDARLEQWATDAYAEIRAVDDVAEIAVALADAARQDGSRGFRPEEIELVRQHLFLDEHPIDSDDGRRVVPRRYDPHPDIAEAWLRLRTGEYLPADLVLLEHELAEARYFAAHPTASYAEAHAAANHTANWQDRIPRRLSEVLEGFEGALPPDRFTALRQLVDDGGREQVVTRLCATLDELGIPVTRAEHAELAAMTSRPAPAAGPSGPVPGALDRLTVRG
ncbi:hypothetical protein GCM10027280_57060 [Micromonospora polyrhachis]|uniref:Outer membrane channel protein CpnT-like N-terminal domain-containing protein n=1 Tax=Micromonospora polyrhachis TaxID=1282883 RepID=A0A7W7WQV6_9ACTN|nr:hypothetical protein [Micromonospora polyrhachis]MBB4960229.1 hypothetical protein [Micromonospora polyrhachis]